MSQQKPSAREMEELEGALLLPEATLVVEYEKDERPKTSSEAPVAAAASVLEVEASVPASYFATGNSIPSDSASSTVPSTSLEDAPYAQVIPHGAFATTNLHDSARDARDLQTAQRRGFLSVEEERIANQRNAREIRAIQYHQSQAIRQANQHAQLKDWQATRGLDQTTAAMAERHAHSPTKNNDSTPAQSKKVATTTSSEPPSTFGKDYEVADYSVGEGYQTQDYQVSEYKSIYE